MSALVPEVRPAAVATLEIVFSVSGNLVNVTMIGS